MSKPLHSKKLVIVGCGASAVLALAALANYSRDHVASVASAHSSDAIHLDITIIDDNSARPRGLAYSAIHPSLILNVPAQRMGAFSDDPAHFFRWLQQTVEWRGLHPAFAGLTIAANDFVSRAIYGAYLADVFDQALYSLRIAGHSVGLYSGRVSAIEKNSSSGVMRVITYSGRTYDTNALLLATGNYPALQNIPTAANILSSPYVNEALGFNWKNSKNILVLGSGLSLVDVVQLAISQGFAGKFHVVSAHGLLPCAHGESHHPSVPVFKTEAKKGSAILGAIRQYIKRNEEKGIAWQCSVNQLREQNNALWSQLNPKERSRLKRALPWWNSVRHRIPASTRNLLEHLQTKEQLCIYPARVNNIHATHNGFSLSLASARSKNARLEIIADKAIICTGYRAGFSVVQDLCKGLLDDSAVLTANFIGNNHYRISSRHEVYGIGPALTGVLFETTAIQEIREQAVCIAKAIFTTTADKANTNTNSTQAVGIVCTE